MAASAHAISWTRRSEVPASALRSIVQWLVLIPIVRWFCRPLRVTGHRELPLGPMLLVANHASHADTVAFLAALPWRIRRTLAPAAAEDYFFSSRLKGACVRLLTGAFPFPRHGDEGLRRARRLLAQGRSVLLFPEARVRATAPLRRSNAALRSLRCSGIRLWRWAWPGRAKC